MTLPKPDYSDPADVAERRERKAVDLSHTCYACLHRYLYQKEYACMLEDPEFPHKTQETCRWWARRS